VICPERTDQMTVVLITGALTGIAIMDVIASRMPPTGRGTT
jgi:hypothetical protein